MSHSPAKAKAKQPPEGVHHGSHHHHQQHYKASNSWESVVRRARARAWLCSDWLTLENVCHVCVREGLLLFAMRECFLTMRLAWQLVVCVAAASLPASLKLQAFTTVSHLERTRRVQIQFSWDSDWNWVYSWRVSQSKEAPTKQSLAACEV